MGVFGKLLTALQGASREAEAGVEDNQALHVLEREIRESKHHLSEARENLMVLVAKQMEIERNLKPMQSAYARYEAEATQALGRGEEKLAAQHAERMAELENELEAQREILNSYRSSVQELKLSIKAIERDILSVEREINVIKTLESVHKAGLSSDRLNQAGGLSASAQDALQRVKERQQKRSDQRSAALQVRRDSTPDELRARLKSAGITQNASSREDIMQRLKVEQALRNDRVKWVKKNVY